MTTDTDFKDLPKAQIVSRAERVIHLNGGPEVASVHFKWTCKHCGARVMFEEANTIYDDGECGECGKETKGIKGYGFMLVLTVPREGEKQ